MSGAIATNVILHDPALTVGPDEKHERRGSAAVEIPPYYEGTGPMQVSYLNGANPPTEEELRTLRRVPGKINFSAYTIAFVELCERFSFYGTTVVYTNFIKNPRVQRTGRALPGDSDGVAGALGMGAQAAAGITTFNQFWFVVVTVPYAG